jgi:hypothetical protein
MTIVPKKTSITLMAGESFWSKLITPDTKFKTEGEYVGVVRIAENTPLKAEVKTKDGRKLSLTLAEVIALIDAEAAEELAAARSKSKTPAEVKKWETKYLPYKYVEDENGDRTGEIEFKTSMKASGVSKKNGKPWKMEPRLFDGSGVPITGKVRNSLRIGNGSVLALACTIQPYSPTAQIGASVKLSLEAAQIIDLKGGGGDASSFGFGAAAGGFSAASVDTSADDEDQSEDQVIGAAPGDDDDF